MTAKTSEHLAQVLHAAGLFELEKRARADEFHDFLSDHATPELVLDGELVMIIRAKGLEKREGLAAMNIRERLHDGEFDASLEESDEWAASPAGQDVLGKLGRGE